MLLSVFIINGNAQELADFSTFRAIFERRLRSESSLGLEIFMNLPLRVALKVCFWGSRFSSFSASGLWYFISVAHWLHLSPLVTFLVARHRLISFSLFLVLIWFDEDFSEICWADPLKIDTQAILYRPNL